MLAKCLIALSVLLLVACSGDANEPPVPRELAAASESRIFPEGLDVSALPGGNGVLEVTALTLRRGATSGELYVALKNVGGAPACSPTFSLELFDGSGRSLAIGLGGLLVPRFYRIVAAPDTVAGCVGPGDVTMAAITDLPAELSLEDATHLVYWCNYWALEGSPVAGVDITDVVPVLRASGVGFAGIVHNAFDLVLNRPSVTVFPLNHAGRPLGMANADSPGELLPGASWHFETGTISERGVEWAAFPSHGP